MRRVPQPFGGDITLYSATQIPHILKIMVALTLGIPEHQLRVVAPARRRRLRLEAQRLRRGAALRSRSPASTACRCAGSRSAPRTRRPPSRAAARSRTSSWPPTPTASSPRSGSTCSRHGRLPAAGHARHPAARRVPLRRRLRPAGGYSFTCTSVFTTMTPTDAYRGAGRPEATYAIERAMDALAAEDRRRPGRAAPAQLHQGRAVPVHRHDRPASTTRGDHEAALDKALELADYDGLRAEQARPPGGRRRPSTSASASRRTSRCAGWRRRGCSPR